MATRAEKDIQIDGIREMLGEANSLFLVDLAGLSSNDLNILRAELRTKGAGMRVVKNRLAKRAIEGTTAEKLEEWFSGPTAVVYHPSEPMDTAKSLVEFAKTNPELGIKGALIDQTDTVDAMGVEMVSKLPGLDGTRAMLLQLINGPATKLVRLLNTPATQMVTVVKKHAEAQGGSE